MRGIEFVLIVGLAIAGLALGTGAGASTGKPATAAKSPQIRDVIIKGGVRSLGPLPARAQKLLKGLRASDTPFFSCSGASTKSNTAAAQTCVWPASYTGQVACTCKPGFAGDGRTCTVIPAPEFSVFFTAPTIRGGAPGSVQRQPGMTVVAPVSDPTGLAVDAAGNIYFGEVTSAPVRVTSADESVTRRREKLE